MASLNKFNKFGNRHPLNSNFMGKTSIRDATDKSYVYPYDPFLSPVLTRKLATQYTGNLDYLAKREKGEYYYRFPMSEFNRSRVPVPILDEENRRMYTKHHIGESTTGLTNFGTELSSTLSDVNPLTSISSRQSTNQPKSTDNPLRASSTSGWQTIYRSSSGNSLEKPIVAKGDVSMGNNITSNNITGSNSTINNNITANSNATAQKTKPSPTLKTKPIVAPKVMYQPPSSPSSPAPLDKKVEPTYKGGPLVPATQPSTSVGGALVTYGGKAVNFGWEHALPALWHGLKDYAIPAVTTAGTALYEHYRKSAEDFDSLAETFEKTPATLIGTGVGAAMGAAVGSATGGAMVGSVLGGGIDSMHAINEANKEEKKANAREELLQNQQQYYRDQTGNNNDEFDSLDTKSSKSPTSYRRSRGNSNIDSNQQSFNRRKVYRSGGAFADKPEPIDHSIDSSTQSKPTSTLGGKPNEFQGQNEFKFTNHAQQFEGERHAPGYNYMGPGTRLDLRLEPSGLPKRGFEPINELDSHALVHDKAYQDVWEQYLTNKSTKEQATGQVHQADEAFIQGAQKIDTPWAKFAARAIKAKRFGESIGVFPTEAISLPKKDNG